MIAYLAATFVMFVLMKLATHFTKIPFVAWWLLFALVLAGALITRSTLQ